MPTVAQLIREHVTLEVHCIDRLSLNGCVPRLQSEGGWSPSSAGRTGSPFPRQHCAA